MNCVWTNGWIKELIGGVFLWALYFFCKKIVKSEGFGFFKKFVKTSLRWNRVFFPALKVLFFCLGFFYCMDVLGRYLGFSNWMETLRPFRNTIIVLIFAWILYRFKQEFLRVRFPEWHALSKLFSVCIVILAGLTILRVFNLDIIPLLAFGGIGAAALGFSAKDVIGSLFGGIMLSITRPFIVGDLLFIPDKEIEGSVEEIGWSFTLIRDKDRRLVYLPNTMFSQVLVINLSQRTGRRILESFRLRYSDFDKLPSILAEVRKFLEQFSAVDKRFPILVFISEIGTYSVDFSVDIYTEATALADYVMIKQKVLEQIFSIVMDKQAQIAYPVSLREI